MNVGRYFADSRTRVDVVQVTRRTAGQPDQMTYQTIQWVGYGHATNGASWFYVMKLSKLYIPPDRKTPPGPGSPLKTCSSNAPQRKDP